METKESSKSNNKWIIYILLALLLVVCAAGVWIVRGNMQRVISSQAIAAKTDTPTPQQTKDVSSADEGEPPGSPLETTPTPTEFIPIIVIKVEQVDVRTGPDPVFPSLIQVKRGLSLRAVGRNAENTHLLILLPDNRQGWIPIEAAEFDFDLELLPVVGGPPTPEPQPGETVEPYGQGMLAPPQIPDIAPVSPGNPGRRALGLASAMLLLFLVVGARSRAGDPLGLVRPLAARLAQMLTTLL